MCDRQDSDVLFRRHIGEVVRERADGHSTHLERLVDPVEQRAGERPPRQVIDGFVDRSQERKAEASALFLVPG